MIIIGTRLKMALVWALASALGWAPRRTTQRDFGRPTLRSMTAQLGLLSSCQKLKKKNTLTAFDIVRSGHFWSFCQSPAAERASRGEPPPQRERAVLCAGAMAVPLFRKFVVRLCATCLAASVSHQLLPSPSFSSQLNRSRCKALECVLISKRQMRIASR